MEMFELTLLLLAAVIISTFVDQVLPRVSLPLVQIGLGLILGLVLTNSSDAMISSDLFLVLLIAPLLFDESRKTDKVKLWKNIRPILSLAIGLVIAIVLVVGFVLHWIEPSITLAAAFALGAALGPTDAVAVSSLGKEMNMSDRQRSILSGESLLNDASGVVSFHFAIAAATTGAFSLIDASLTFVLDFFGGIAVGLVLGFLALLASRFMNRRGYENVTTHVVFEIFTPFVVYIIAEAIDVSGILAVVAAGLLITLVPQPVTATSAKLSITSESVWEVLVFVVNGIVFVLLGMQLPQAILPGWTSVSMNNALIIGASFLIVAVLFAVRFVWLLVMELCTADRAVSGRNCRAP